MVDHKEIKQGGRLPSIRSMACEFKCNKSTVIRAYQELELKHKIYAIPKGGYYLLDKKNEDRTKGDYINFNEVLLDPKLLPYKEFNHSINRVVDLYKDNLFTYNDTQGLLTLRKTLRDHFTDYQIFTKEENICITTGAQQALNILSKIDFPNGKTDILVEQPTYSLMNRLLEINGNRILGIKRGFSGIDFNQLEEIFKNESIKFFYIIPRFHNPLGTSYSEKDKKTIVDLANKYDVYIVEDDYLADLELNRKRLPTFYYDDYGRVIYIKSFSKTFMPGIRIGAIVMNEALKNEFLIHKKCIDLNTSVLTQGALENFINSGMYKKHIVKVKSEYRKKMNCLKEVLEKFNIQGVDFYVPETGIFLWVKLSNNIDLNSLVNNLKYKNIFINSGSEHFIRSIPPEKGFRICISNLSLEDIKIGIVNIAEEIEKLKC